VYKLSTLDALQLTGRSRSHVIDIESLRATLHPEAASAYAAMRTAAAADGIELRAASSFRDFARQVSIWNEKFRGERTMLDRSGCAMDGQCLDPAARVEAILWWSALPGASRHHWGTDLDVIDRAAVPPGARVHLTPAEFGAGGPFERLDIWLRANMARFGFFRPYERDLGGVSPEAWHLSYAPIAEPALAGLTLEVLAAAVADAAIDGREAVQAQLAQIHERYVGRVDLGPMQARAARFAPWAAAPPGPAADHDSSGSGPGRAA
jgi:LAS superfamily LD-carboxypeptidase LdcB